MKYIGWFGIGVAAAFGFFVGCELFAHTRVEDVLDWGLPE